MVSPVDNIWLSSSHLLIVQKQESPIPVRRSSLSSPKLLEIRMTDQHDSHHAQ